MPVRRMEGRVPVADAHYLVAARNFLLRENPALARGSDLTDGLNIRADELDRRLRHQSLAGQQFPLL